MKLYPFVTFLAISFFLLFSNEISAQKKSGISFSYDYSLLLTPSYKIHYPFGLDISYSNRLKEKVILKTGLTLIRKTYDDNNFWVNETQGNFERRYVEKMFQLNVGLYYPLIDNKISMQLGVNVLPNYTRFKMVVTDAVTAPNGKEITNLFSLGVSSSLIIDYSISQKMSLSLEPGYSYYIIGDYKKYDFFNMSLGFTYYFM